MAPDQWAEVRGVLSVDGDDLAQSLVLALQQADRVPGIVVVARAGRSWQHALRDPDAAGVLAAGLLGIGCSHEAATILTIVTAAVHEQHACRTMTDRVGSLLDGYPDT